jgi:hypothetical protein
MIELQRTTVVQETRSAFQTAMQHKFIAAVERLSGREVLAFVSNHHVGPDMEIELFMLKPKPNQTANPLDDAAVPARGTQTTRSRGTVQCLMPVETPVRWEARANPQRRERMGSRAARRGLGVDVERHATGTRASTKPDRRHRFRIGLRMSPPAFGFPARRTGSAPAGGDGLEVRDVLLALDDAEEHGPVPSVDVNLALRDAGAVEELSLEPVRERHVVVGRLRGRAACVNADRSVDAGHRLDVEESPHDR